MTAFTAWKERPLFNVGDEVYYVRTDGVRLPAIVNSISKTWPNGTPRELWRYVITVNFRSPLPSVYIALAADLRPA